MCPAESQDDWISLLCHQVSIRADKKKFKKVIDTCRKKEAVTNDRVFIVDSILKLNFISDVLLKCEGLRFVIVELLKLLK